VCNVPAGSSMHRGFSHDMIRPVCTAPRIVLTSRLLQRSFVQSRPRPSLHNRSYITARTSPAQTIQPARTSSRSLATMASATSFYDFKPKDSSSSPPPSLPIPPPLTPSRKRLSLPPLLAQKQSRPRRQHSLEMRLHAAIRGARETLQRPQSHLPQRL
jgi:hypothetical protein